MREFARARPLLGTIVEMRVAGLAEAAALAAIEAAFAEVADLHRLMSFHERGSDLSRLHRGAARAPVAVDTRTYEVLQAGLAIAAESDGCFDPSVAVRLVEWDLLPAPESCVLPDPRADWRDIELLDRARVRFARPLWIDLGGIAKGYAVDRALAMLRARGACLASVNAGGDLRRFGPRAEIVPLRLAPALDTAVPALELADAAVATSAGHATPRRIGGPHVDGRSRRVVARRRSVSVVAPTCLVADALTKVVLADAGIGARLLRRYEASACLYDEKRGWRMLGDP